MMLPSWPGWDGLHPLIIHFPIGLLMVAPLFVALALLWTRRANEYMRAALLLLVIGTAATFVAVSTGKAAGELADHTEAINGVLEGHEERAEDTRNAFAALTVLYAVFMFLPTRVAKLARPAYTRAGNAVFLVLLLFATLMLVNTAHQGGRLVHQFGVHAMMAPAAPGT